jgi:hypothetical protein
MFVVRRCDGACKIPECGMQLVPKYAHDETGKMPAGTVKIALEKQ